MHQSGKKYKHKRTGSLMTIEKLGKFCATCKLDIPKEYYFHKIKYYNYTAICRLENLIEIEQTYTQTTLF